MLLFGRPGGAAPSRRRTGPRLLSDVEALDEVRVPLRVLALEVIEQSPAFTDQHQQSAARVVIFCVGLEVLGQVVDAFAENRDLNLGGAGIAVVRAVAANELGLAVFG